MTELWLRLEGFYEILSTRNVLIEIGLLALALALGAVSAAVLQLRQRRRGRHVPRAPSAEYFIPQSSVAVMPAVIVLVIILLARSGLENTSLDVTLLMGAARLVGAYIAVRLGVMVYAASLGDKSWIQSWETRATF